MIIVNVLFSGTGFAMNESEISTTTKVLTSYRTVISTYNPVLIVLLLVEIPN